MKTECECRVVMDDLTGEDIGIVMIEMDKWNGAHWIIDPDGDKRFDYKFRIIDRHTYDMALAVETHPVLKVIYMPFRNWMAYYNELFWLCFVVGIVLSAVAAIILGGFILLSDLELNLKDSIWFWAGYAFLVILTIGGSIAGLISNWCSYVTRNEPTAKDMKISKWRHFKTNSQVKASK